MLPRTTLAGRVTAEQLGSDASRDLAVWLFFQLAADHVLLPLLVATLLLSRNITRRPTVVNVCCTWIIAGVASALLLYVGEETGPEPGQSLCIAQSALLSGVLPMTSVACLALVYDNWSSIKPTAVQARRKVHPGYIVTAFLLCAPYLALALFVAIGAKLGAEYRDKVDRDQHFFYCAVDLTPFIASVALFSVLVSLAAVGLYAHLILKLCRNRNTLRRPGQTDDVNIAFLVRVGVYALYMLTATVANLVLLGDEQTVFPDMFIASVGMAVFLIFGSQRELIQAWRFWRRPVRNPRTIPASPVMPRAPFPSFDLDLMKRTDSDVSEKARLEALRNYYSARVRGEGVGVQIIERPEDAFIPGRDVHRASDLSAKAKGVGMV